MEATRLHVLLLRMRLVVENSQQRLIHLMVHLMPLLKLQNLALILNSLIINIKKKATIK
jgi:hypothetical protein